MYISKLRLIPLMLVTCLSTGLTGCFDFMDCPEFMGCQKPDDPNNYKSSDIHMGPNGIDPVLDLSKPGPFVVMPEGDFDTDKYFNFIENLELLGDRTGEKVLSEIAEELLFTFYKHPSTHSRTNFAHSPYSDLLSSRAKPEYMEATKDLDEFIHKQKIETHKSVMWAQQELKLTDIDDKDLNLKQVITLLLDYMDKLSENVSKSNMDDAVKMEINLALQEQFWSRQGELTELTNRLANAKTFPEALETLKTIIKSLNVNLDPESNKRVSNAELIAKRLGDKYDFDTKSAYALVIEIWMSITEQERKEIFGSLSPDLYDHLSGKDHDDLICAKADTCSGIIENWIARPAVIKGIKEYGLKRLKDTVDEQATTALTEEATAQAKKFVKEMPEMIQNQIYEGLENEAERYKTIRQNFERFVREQVQKWYENQFNVTELPALENRKIRIKRSSDGLDIRGLFTNGHIETNAKTLGAALIASVGIIERLAKSGDNRYQLLMLQRINQLLAHGGFNLANGRAFKSLSRGWRRSDSEFLNIEKKLNTKDLITMPSPVRIIRGYQLPQGDAPEDFRIEEQAKLLNGFSHIMHLFRDWDTSPVDFLTEDFLVKELLQDLPADKLDMPAFPKEAFLALALGNVSAVLNNLTAKGTPLFRQCTEGGYRWEDVKENCNRKTSLAGLIEIRNGVRLDQVYAVKLAQFLKAVLSFIKSSEQLAKTQSKYLTEPGEDGSEAPINQFLEAKPRLNELAIGLTNYLSHIMMRSGGGVYTINKIGERPKPEKIAQFDTQLEVLDALAASAKYFNIKPYRSSTQDAYHYLNNTFWNEDTQFYTDKKNVNVATLTKTLVVLQNIEPVIESSRSRAQIRAVVNKYTRKLKQTALEYLGKN